MSVSAHLGRPDGPGPDTPPDPGEESTDAQDDGALPSTGGTTDDDAQRPPTDDTHPTNDTRPDPDTHPDGSTQPNGEPNAKPAKPRWRTALGWTITAAALLLVQAALILPSTPDQLTPKTLARVPLEGLVAAALMLALPTRAQKILAPILGVLIGILALVKVLDIGFVSVLVRPFDPVSDWVLIGDGINFLVGSFGTVEAWTAVGAIGVLFAGLLAFLAMAVRRLGNIAAAHRTGATRALGVLTIVWVACATLGGTVPGLPIASASSATVAYQTARAVPTSIRDRREFTEAARTDAFRDTPDSRLLTGLKGNDVILAFVESYGRDAVEDPNFAPHIDPLLDDGSRQLQAAGFAAKSGYLTSSTIGGGSWLAHSTLQSGLWIDNQQRYRTLVTSDRRTLTSLFHRADWRTVGIMPGITSTWPEADFYQFDRVYDNWSLGFKGERYNMWSSTPDQYCLSALQRLELSKTNRARVMAEIEFTTSHAPWIYQPKLVPYDQVGDGSATVGHSPSPVATSPARIQAQYRDTIEYSLRSLISFMTTYGNDHTVLIFLGDHQPVPVITGKNASHDVPITVVAKDPAVLNRIADWGWTDGLRPAHDAPVWKMDSFRDRFLTAFGPQ